MIRLFGVLCAAFLTVQMAVAQGAGGLAENAINLNRYGQTLEGPARHSVMLDVRRILDRVVIEHPNSREARVIQSGGVLGSLSVAALNAELSGQPIPNFDSGTAKPVDPGRPPLLGDGGPARVIPFDPKERMKAIQETLNARGCKTGTPDGVAGRNTTRGYQRFLREKGLSEAQYPIDSEAFWNALVSSKGEVCEVVIVPVNARTMLGNWTYVSRCGSRSRMPGQKITGVLSLRSGGGNRFRGQLANSQGLRANISGQTTGRQVTFTANFGFLFGKVTGRGTVEEEAYVVHGRDSHGCRFTARKR